MLLLTNSIEFNNKNGGKVKLFWRKKNQLPVFVNHSYALENIFSKLSSAIEYLCKI